MSKTIYQTTRKFRDGCKNPYPPQGNARDNNTHDFMFRVLGHFCGGRINVRLSEIDSMINGGSKVRAKLMKQLVADGFVKEITSK